MVYFRFFLTHPRILSFGLLLTLFSSFGQTFLVSIFVPHLLEEFSLNTAQFGSLYAAATLTSAAGLPFLGRLIDRVPLRRFSVASAWTIDGGLAVEGRGWFFAHSVRQRGAGTGNSCIEPCRARKTVERSR